MQVPLHEGFAWPAAHYGWVAVCVGLPTQTGVHGGDRSSVTLKSSG